MVTVSERELLGATLKCPNCCRWIPPDCQPQEPTDEGGAEFSCVHCNAHLYDQCEYYGGGVIVVCLPGCEHVKEWKEVAAAVKALWDYKIEGDEPTEEDLKDGYQHYWFLD